MAQSAIHFWNPGTGSSSKIAILGQLGPNHGGEDVVRHAWGAILGQCLIGVLPLGPYCYTIDGFPKPRPSKYVAVVKMQTMDNPMAGGGPPLTVSRDVLWVECKAANHDTPVGWKDSIEQASARLAAWDPMASVNASPLQVLADNQAQNWTLPPQLRYDPTIPGQSHVVAAGNRAVPSMIDTALAYSLDYWTQDQGQIKNEPGLRLLENCIAHILTTNYPGNNPPEMP